MLSQIRHIQKGVLIVVCVVIVIAFAFLYSDYDARGGAGNTAFVLYGKAYRDKEAKVLMNSYKVANQLGMSEFARSLFGEERLDSDLSDYMVNLVILREEAKRLGIQPSSEEVQKAIPNLPIFSYITWAGEDYIRNNITGPAGFTDSDLYQLVKDYLSWRKIHELLSSGIEPTPEEIDRIYIRDFQRISGSVIAFSQEEEEKKLKISDKEIEKFYQDNKDSKELLSPEKRSASYIHIAGPKLKDDATNEQKAEHQEKEKEFKKKVAEIYEQLAEEGQDFKKLAEKHKLKVEEVGLVSIADISDKDLEEKGDVYRAVFSLSMEQVLSPPIRQEDGSYYIVHLNELREPAPQSLEDARDSIRNILKDRKSGELVQAAASDIQTKIREAMKAGKSFEDAAKSAGVKPVKLPFFARDEPPADTDNAGLIVATASGLKAGELSNIVETPTGAILVYVDKKVIYESELEEQRKNMIKGRLSLTDSRDLYKAWFQSKRNVVMPMGPPRPAAPPQS